MRRYVLTFQKGDGEYGRVVEAYSLVEAQWMAHRLGWVCQGEVDGRVTLPTATPGWLVWCLKPVMRARQRVAEWLGHRIPMTHYEIVKGFD